MIDFFVPVVAIGELLQILVRSSSSLLQVLNTRTVTLDWRTDRQTTSSHGSSGLGNDSKGVARACAVTRDSCLSIELDPTTPGSPCAGTSVAKQERNHNKKRAATSVGRKQSSLGRARWFVWYDQSGLAGSTRFWCLQQRSHKSQFWTRVVGYV